MKPKLVWDFSANPEIIVRRRNIPAKGLCKQAEGVDQGTNENETGQAGHESGGADTEVTNHQGVDKEVIDQGPDKEVLDLGADREVTGPGVNLPEDMADGLLGHGLTDADIVKAVTGRSDRNISEGDIANMNNGRLPCKLCEADKQRATTIMYNQRYAKRMKEGWKTLNCDGGLG